VLGKSAADIHVFDYMEFDVTMFCVFVIISSLECDTHHFIFVGGICFVLFVMQAMF
jgi:hypothetical protein